MKHCPELENSSELGEDTEREVAAAVCVCVCVERIRWRRGVDNDDGQTRGSPPSIKATGM